MNSVYYAGDILRSSSASLAFKTATTLRLTKSAGSKRNNSKQTKTSELPWRPGTRS